VRRPRRDDYFVTFTRLYTIVTFEVLPSFAFDVTTSVMVFPSGETAVGRSHQSIPRP
jgi:hypothetical protein